MPTLYAIDPSETWEVDFSLEVARRRVEIRERMLADARRDSMAAAGSDRQVTADAAVEVAEKLLAEARDELAGYPRGSGPIFTMGHIPGAKRAEIEGMAREISELPTEHERRVADFSWQREVVRWAVRGHRGLERRGGGEVPFDVEAVPFDGEARQVPSRRTLEVYAGSGILFDLAIIAYVPQRLQEQEKNASWSPPASAGSSSAVMPAPKPPPAVAT